LNRVDDIVVFKALAKAQVRDIANLMLKNLNERVSNQVKITLSWDEAVLTYLADEGYEPNFGARPLRRLLTHVVETELSKAIIRGDVAEGDNVTMTVTDGRLCFK
ncbi:MAG: ATP-dependent chaperone ClpB, partial [Anaerovibrio sp.]|nr:ATP-dependent chaperone ClpB [Anaerovibrio sp.]